MLRFRLGVRADETLAALLDPAQVARGVASACLFIGDVFNQIRQGLNAEITAQAFNGREVDAAQIAAADTVDCTDRQAGAFGNFAERDLPLLLCYPLISQLVEFGTQHPIVRNKVMQLLYHAFYSPHLSIPYNRTSVQNNEHIRYTIGVLVLTF